MIGGWIKMHYSLLDWEWYDDNNVKILFFHCLLKANWQDKKWRGNVVRRGQFITSYENLSNETNLSIQQIRTAINKLKSTGEITTQSTNNFTMVTISNYESYQDKKNTSNKPNNKPLNNPVTNEQQTSNKRITTTKEYKNNKKEKNIRHIGVNNSFLDDCLGSPIWIESICRLNNTTKPEVKLHLQRFNDYLISTEDNKQNLKEFKSHFSNWFKNQDFKEITKRNTSIF